MMMVMIKNKPSKLPHLKISQQINQDTLNIFKNKNLNLIKSGLIKVFLIKIPNIALIRKSLFYKK